MKFLRRLVAILTIFILLLAFWIWWNRPTKVDMSAYVPADSLLYLEMNNLPQVVGGLTSTNGWNSLAGPAGIKTGLGRVGWFDKLAAWTGIGTADTIVYSRMQVAAAVLGLEAADGGQTLNVKPRVALVVETHSSAARTLATIEKNVGNFALRAYDNPRIEKKEIDGVHWIIWNSPSTDRRIVSAMIGSVAIIGNEEKAVEACLAVRRGERPSLSGNLELEEARLRVPYNGTLAFAFIPSQGATMLSELVSAIYLGQLSDEAQEQSIAQNLVPQVAKKILGSVAWSTRLAEGRIEDSYFMSVNNDAGARLRSALSPTSSGTLEVTALLPSDTYSVTRYDTRDALTAWRGLSFSISSQLDPLLAIIVPRFLEAALTPYGIEDSDLFLQAIGPSVVTARLENGGHSTVLVVEVRDEKTLRALVLKRLGPTPPQIEMVGDAEMLSSTDEKRGAASFVNGHLLMGPKASVRKCLDARQHGDGLSVTRTFEPALGTSSLQGTSHVLTLTNDFVPAGDFIVFVSSQPLARATPADTKLLDMKLDQLSYAISEMNFVEGGIERRTRSTFGLLGTLATQFNPKK